MKARVLTMVALAASLTLAQEPPGMMRVTTFKVDLAHVYEFEDAQKMLNEAYKKAGVSMREMWTTTIAGDTGVYVAVAAVKSMAQFDDKSPVATQMSDTERQRYQAKMRDSVRESHSELVRPRGDLSMWSDAPMKPDIKARVTMVHVLPGKAAEFEDVIKTSVLPALKKAGIKNYFVNQTAIGGPVGSFTTVTVFDKYADPGALPLSEAVMGAEEFRKFQARLATCTASAESMFVRRIPDLSYPNP